MNNSSSFIDLCAPDNEREQQPSERRRKRKRAIDLTQSQPEEEIKIDDADADEIAVGNSMYMAGRERAEVHGPAAAPPSRSFRPPSTRPSYQTFLDTQIPSRPSASSRGAPSSTSGPSPSSFHFLARNLNQPTSRIEPSPQPSHNAQAAADERLAKRIQEEEDARVAASLARSFESEDNRRMMERMEALGAMEEMEEPVSMAMVLESLSERALATIEAGRRRGRPDPQVDRRGRGGGRGPMAPRYFLPPPEFFRAMLGEGEEEENHGRRRGRHRNGGEDRAAGGRVGMGRPAAHYGGQMAQLAAAGIHPSLIYGDRDFGPEDYEMLQRLDENVENRNGASFEEIEQLPTVVATGGGRGEGEGAEAKCCICLEEIEPGSNLRILPCLHKDFHQICVDQWLIEKSVCPVCQSSVKN